VHTPIRHRLLPDVGAGVERERVHRRHLPLGLDPSGGGGDAKGVRRRTSGGLDAVLKRPFPQAREDPRLWDGVARSWRVTPSDAAGAPRRADIAAERRNPDAHPSAASSLAKSPPDKLRPSWLAQVRPANGKGSLGQSSRQAVDTPPASWLARELAPCRQRRPASECSGLWAQRLAGAFAGERRVYAVAPSAWHSLTCLRRSAPEGKFRNLGTHLAVVKRGIRRLSVHLAVQVAVYERKIFR